MTTPAVRDLSDLEDEGLNLGPSRSELNTPDPDPGLELDDEAPARTQVGQRVRCHLAGAAPFEVRVINRDRIAWERTARKHNWGAPADSPNLAMTFVCWNAAKREGLTALTWPQFEDALEDYDVLGVEEARPTRPTA